MAPPLTDSYNEMSASNTITAVAIDKDKNSQYAVKWTIDHLLSRNNRFILIHITQGFALNEASYDAYRESTDQNIQQLFLPYRGYCTRKGVQAREVVLENLDVSKALIDYINVHCINNIVVGASTRNALTRKFRNPDVATSLNKSAPDFCTVFVISKGKVISVRSASRLPPLNVMNDSGASSPIISTSPKKALPLLPPLENSDSDNSIKRIPSGGGDRESCRGTTRVLERSMDRELMIKLPPKGRSIPYNSSMENLDQLPARISRDSLSVDSDFSCSTMGFRSIDIDSESLEFSGIFDYSPTSSSFSSNYSRDLELEMKRLRLELKQTMDLYSTACKEAICAKQKAQELHRWKIEEALKFEEARHAEEAALAIAEMEKAKCKVAIEAAEAARKLAEREASRRRHAELKAKREAEERVRALAAVQNKDVRYRKYTIDDIEAATNSFMESMKIGEGGYGPVYQASLDQTPVAIKVLRPDAKQGRQQFQQEVEILSCIRHPNMVLLLGACPEYGCLVYEYMENGSLEDRLFRRGNTPSIPWMIRFKIAAEIATGLHFLHQTKPEPLVHRDLKPANILLDSNYVSKISDVGLARLVPPSVADCVTQYRMTSAAGTFCYIDPEYQATGMLGIKSDVYSLGIILLQILTGMPPMGLSHEVNKAIEDNTFEAMLDPSVPDWPVEEALEYAKVALKCAEIRRKDRPDLASVVLPVLNRLRHIGSEAYSHETSCCSSTCHSYRPQYSYNYNISSSRFSNQELMRSNT